MDHQKKALRFGAAAIALALFLRLGAGNLYQMAVNWLSDPTIQSFLIYLETGRNVRFSPSLEEFTDPVGESPPPGLFLSHRDIPIPRFTAEDAAGIQLYYGCGLRPEVAPLLTQSLHWDLCTDSPTVLILHTHTTESYTKAGEAYEESSAYRTLDEQYNMVAIGEQVVRVLAEKGITAIHDTELHDYPSYNGSYSHARKSIQRYLEQYPSIQLVLDLHRDASGDLSNQFRPVAAVDGEDTAQLMVVIGTNASGLNHPDWEKNLALGLKLHSQLERIAPGITRPLCLRSSRFNQDLLPGALLIEVGAAGNTQAEALRAAEILAQTIASLAKGTQSEEQRPLRCSRGRFLLFLVGIGNRRHNGLSVAVQQGCQTSGVAVLDEQVIHAGQSVHQNHFRPKVFRMNFDKALFFLSHTYSSHRKGSSSRFVTNRWNSSAVSMLTRQKPVTALPRLPQVSTVTATNAIATAPRSIFRHILMGLSPEVSASDSYTAGTGFPPQPRSAAPVPLPKWQAAPYPFLPAHRWLPTR